MYNLSTIYTATTGFKYKRTCIDTNGQPEMNNQLEEFVKDGNLYLLKISIEEMEESGSIYLPPKLFEIAIENNHSDIYHFLVEKEEILFQKETKNRLEDDKKRILAQETTNFLLEDNKNPKPSSDRSFPKSRLSCEEYQKGIKDLEKSCFKARMFYNEYQKRIEERKTRPIRSAISAAKLTNLNFLKDLLKEDLKNLNNENFKKELISSAISFNRINNLIFLKEQNIIPSPDSYIIAAEKGFLNILKWLELELNITFPKNINLLTKIIKSKNIECMNWAINCGFICDDDVIEAIIYYGNIDQMNWLLSNKIKIPEWVIEIIIDTCNISLLKFILRSYDRNSFIQKNHFYKLLINNSNSNSIELIYILIEYGCGIEYNIQSINDVLKWGIDNKCNYDELYRKALMIDDIEILQSLISRKFIFSSEKLLKIAIMVGNIQTVSYLIENFFGLKYDICIIAANYKKYDILKWALDVKCKCGSDILLILLKDCKYDLFKELIINRVVDNVTVNTKTCLSIAKENGNESIIKWICENIN